jgi:hypothetical protein
MTKTSKLSRTTVTLDNGRAYIVDVQATTVPQLKARYPRSRAAVATLVTFRLRTETGTTGAPSRISAREVFASNHLTGICTREVFVAAGGTLPVHGTEG